MFFLARLSGWAAAMDRSDFWTPPFQPCRQLPRPTKKETVEKNKSHPEIIYDSWEMDRPPARPPLDGISLSGRGSFANFRAFSSKELSNECADDMPAIIAVGVDLLAFIVFINLHCILHSSLSSSLLFLLLHILVLLPSSNTNLIP